MTPFVPFADRRLAIVDALRGVALLGIILVNVGTFAFPMERVLAGTIPVQSALDRGLLVAIDLFVTGKFFPLFSLLFGFGFAIQLDRAELRRDDASWRLVRRQLMLLLLGVAHAYFIWPGDILAFYGCLGLFLLLFKKTKPRKLSIIAFLTLVVPTVAWCVLLGALTFLSTRVPEIERVLKETAPPSGGLQAGELTQMLASNTLQLRDLALSSAFSSPVSLAMAFCGMALARARWLHDREGFSSAWRSLRRFCIAPAVLGGATVLVASPALSWVDASPGVLAILRFVGLAIGGPALGLIYLASAALQYREGSFNALVTAGRMSLSNYLFQSIACAIIFFGLGLAGHASFSVCIGVALAVWCSQILLSLWWLRRFKFGPVEWLLRSVTYWRVLG